MLVGTVSTPPVVTLPLPPPIAQEKPSVARLRGPEWEVAERDLVAA
jgi:hypothetical protein